MRTKSWSTRSCRRTPARSLALAMAAIAALPAIGQTTASWLDPVDGNWTDPTRWSTNPNYPNNGLPAGSTYQATIGAAGVLPYSVNLQNDITINGLTLNSTNATLLHTAGNLTLLGTLDLQAGTYQATSGWIIGGRIQAEGGQVTLKHLAGVPTVFHNVTLAAPVTGTWDNPLLVDGQLMLDGGSVSLMSRASGGEGAALLGEYGPIAITGTGAVNFDGDNFGYYSSIFARSGLVTIGPGVAVNTRSGGGSLTGFVNQGTINVSTSILFMQGAWTNQGSINLSGGLLELGGSFATADIGQLVRTGGSLTVTGTVNNIGKVLDLSHLGATRIAGTINGGTVTANGSMASLSLVGNSTLNGVTLDADLNLPAVVSYQSLAIANGLTLLNGHRITLTMGGSMDITSISGNGQIVVDGVPNSAGYGTAIHGVVSPNITLATGGPGNLNFTFDGANQGTLLAQTPSVPLRLVSGWSNAGGVVEAVNGGAIELNSNPGSLGNFTVNGATLSITTGISTSQLGQIGATNATELIGSGFIPSGGTLDNTSAVLAIGGNGNTFALAGGQINGGTVTAAVPGTHLHAIGTPVGLPVGYLPTTSTASNVTFALPVDIDDRATLASIGQLTLNGVDVSLGGSSSLTLSTLSLASAGGTSGAIISGQGSIVFNGIGTLNAVTATTALTIGPGITIRTGSGGGSVGSLSVPVINQGLISARTPGRTLTVSGSAYGLSNLGIMEAVNGGSLVLNGLTNITAINASGTGSVTLGGSWGNAGTITLADTARLVLGGTFRATDLGTITLVPGPGGSTAATITLNGTMNNAANVFNLSSLGTGTLFVGTNATIVGGTVAAGAAPSSQLVNVPGAAANLTLNGVTVAAPVSLTSGGSLTFSGGWDNTTSPAFTVTNVAVNFAGTGRSDAVGTFVHSGGSFNLKGTLDNTGRIFSLDDATGSWNLVGGTIVGGTVRTVGSAHLLMPAGSTGTLTGVTLDTDLALPTMGTVTVTGGLTLLNRQITGDTTRLLFSGSNAQTLGGDGSLAYGTNVGNQIQNLSTNTVTVGPGITIHGRSLIIQGGSGGILNQGTIAADAGGIVQLYNVTNQGTLDLSAGATRVNGLLASATPLTLSGGINGGSLGGTGTVRAAIIDGGIISPGPGGIGTLTIDGPVTLTSGGRVLIELSGTARTDLLKISGNLDLSAADDYLDVSKLTTPAMPFGTSFIVATYGGALTGSFDHVTPGYAVSYSTPGQVIVTAVPEPTAAALIGAGVAAFLSSGRRRRTLQRANSKVNTALRR